MALSLWAVAHLQLARVVMSALLLVWAAQAQAVASTSRRAHQVLDAVDVLWWLVAQVTKAVAMSQSLLVQANHLRVGL